MTTRGDYSMPSVCRTLLITRRLSDDAHLFRVKSPFCIYREGFVMSRTGVERKPTWKSVPLPVRRAVESALGAPVARAMRIWGGYSGTPTFRLRLADGRRAFMKGANLESTPFA